MELYSGKMFSVDLSSGEIEIKNLYEDFYEEVVGGIGGNLKLFEEFRDRDPIVIGTGPLTGTLFPASSLGIVTGISPVTGNPAHSPLLWFFPAEFKLSGFDYGVIYGKAEEPSFLWVRNGNVSIKQLPKVVDTWDMCDKIRHELSDDRIQMISAGKEELTNSQLVENYWNSLDRFGFGKKIREMNLFAIACRGLEDILLADPERYMDLCTQALNRARESEFCEDGFEKLIRDSGAEPEINKIKHRNDGCFNCPTPCRVFVKYNEPADELRSTEVEEPGILLTDAESYAEFRKKGMDAEKVSRLMETLARTGIDPWAVAKNLRGELKETLEELKRNPFTYPEKIFSPSKAGENTMLGYVMGICPVAISIADIVELEELPQFISAGADIDIGVERIREVTGKL